MFDNVCKFLAENFASDFAEWIFGSPKGLTVLSPTELSLEPIRVDSLIMLQSEDVVLHLEFQTVADSSMPFRMADYRLRVHRRYPNKEMRQIVIYLKETSSELVQQNSFTISGMRHEFEVIRLWEQPTTDLLRFPGLLPLAVLGQSDNRIQTLRQVSSFIDLLQDRRQKSNVAAATSILAGLVLNKDLIRSVLQEEIMRESVIYQDIKAQGKAEGIKEGEAKGIKKGEISLVLRLLKKRIGTISSEDESRITNLSVEQLETLGEALLDFSSGDDLTTWLANIPNQ
ncbi:MAG: Rpn family recombination-promoting nuclease/putative transposase [Xenococcaceae cyanobacterium MO_207.B15]|nr:Rpn family recombination-promoting nuclease/putative transposase [Xenococcaceae cyanobacterium MO_207.B15]